jgi:thymidylate synthase
MNRRQRVLVFQQNGSGERKIAGVRAHAESSIELVVVHIDAPLPPLIEDTSLYLPTRLEADLVLDYLKHLDLSHDLAALCASQGIPMIASARKLSGQGALTPPTCCGLPRHPGLGAYGERFGAPEFKVTVSGGTVQAIEVLRGAPCGASWEVIERLIGHPVEDAARKIGLEIQYFCSADPANWDPIHGKSPVHFAGRVHEQALAAALAKATEVSPG